LEDLKTPKCPFENQLTFKEQIVKRVHKRKKLKDDIEIHQSQCVNLELKDVLRRIKITNETKKKSEDSQKQAEGELKKLKKKKDEFENKKSDIDENNRKLRNTVLEITQKTSSVQTNEIQLLEEKIEESTRYHSYIT
jgi:chromosome segregation ATPase